MKIEVGKFYKDRIGRKVRIYAIDSGGNFPIHGAYLKNGIWFTATFTKIGKGCLLNQNIDSSDIISEWQEPLNFDWDCLPKWADKYISMDKYGNWRCWNSKRPQYIHAKWMGGDICCIINEDFAPKNFSGYWRDSLFKNPKYKD